MFLSSLLNPRPYVGWEDHYQMKWNLYLLICNDTIRLISNGRVSWLSNRKIIFVLFRAFEKRRETLPSLSSLKIYVWIHPSRNSLDGTHPCIINPSRNSLDGPSPCTHTYIHPSRNSLDGTSIHIYTDQWKSIYCLIWYFARQ